VQCCGVEGGRGHWSERLLVTTTTCVGASWPQIDFPPTLQKQTKTEQGKLETITSQYQKIGKQHVPQKNRHKRISTEQS